MPTLGRRSEIVNAVTEGAWGALVFSLVAIPALVSTAWARHAVREARMARQGIDIERRAQEALEQEPARASWPATSSTCSRRRRHDWPQ